MPTYKWEAGERVPMSAEEEAAYQAGLPDTAYHDEKTEVANRARRDKLLVDTDFHVIKATEAGLATAADMVTYRQALRDLPDHENWPNLEDADWPTAP